MYSNPSQLRNSQTTVRRRQNEMLNGVRAERRAARARAASQTDSSLVVSLRQRAGRLLIATGQWLGGLAAPPAQTEMKQRVAGRS